MDCHSFASRFYEIIDDSSKGKDMGPAAYFKIENLLSGKRSNLPGAFLGVPISNLRIIPENNKQNKG